MHGSADAVPSEFLEVLDPLPRAFGDVVFDCGADLTHAARGGKRRDAFPHCSPGHVDQFAIGFAPCRAHDVGAGGVGVPSVHDAASIHAHHITVANHPSAGDPVHDFLVNAHAHSRREAVVAKEVGLRTGFGNNGTRDLVDVCRRHTAAEVLFDLIVDTVK